MGVAGSVPSGCSQRSRAPGLACKMSSASGPARLEEKRTLKERLTVESNELAGETGLPANGRLEGGEMGESRLARDMPNVVGVIFSHPWRAEPVRLLILCIVTEPESRHPR